MLETIHFILTLFPPREPPEQIIVTTAVVTKESFQTKAASTSNIEIRRAEVGQDFQVRVIVYKDL